MSLVVFVVFLCFFSCACLIEVYISGDIVVFIHCLFFEQFNMFYYVLLNMIVVFLGVLSLWLEHFCSVFLVLLYSFFFLVFLE